MALAALPRAARDRPVLIRTDAAGATHAFVDELTRRGLQFSVGFDLTEPVRQAILAVGEDHWRPAIDTHDHQRPGAWVGELATLDLAGWPQGTRAICRRERPHPGARHKMTFTDRHGHRFQVFITNQTHPDLAWLEARHRAHARVEDRIRCGKASGLGRLPFSSFDANDAWLALVGVAATLVCWAQALLLNDAPDLRVAEPKTLRYRLWHTAGRLVRHAHRVIVRLDRTWPWADALAAAFAKLHTLPAPC
jgi:hypothetical protein